MKRISKFMMALVMIFSMSISAFAAGGTGEGSITIKNATVGETYSVYKIFDATYEDDNVTYTIKSGDKFFTELFGDGTNANDYFEYHAATGVVTRKVDGDGNYIKTNADLFTYLGSLVESASADNSKEAADTTVRFDNLDTGYYVIDRTNGTTNGISITTTKPNATVHDKNHLPSDPVKTADKTTANVGDTVNWKATFTATNYDDGEKVTYYRIKDTLTPAGWAAINIDSIVIKVGGTRLEKGTDWTLVDNGASGFEINIPWVDDGGEFKYAATADVEITYSATVLEGAVSKDPAGQTNKNTAELYYNTNTEPDVPKSETDIKVYNLGFTKVDGTNPSEGLSGAVFGLYSDSACTNPVYVKYTGTEGVYIVDPDSTSNSVTTPASGQVVIQGLAAGTYYLQETTAPDGYNELTTSVEVVIEADVVDPSTGNVTEQKGSKITVGSTIYHVNNAELNIENFSGIELPSTGGEGTIMMITIGTVVAIAFAVLLITQKKMSIYRD